MVQQAAMGGLRSRQGNYTLGRRKRQSLGHQEDTHLDTAVEATVEAGLRPRVLTKTELARFKSNTNEYFEARDFVLVQWQRDQTHFLTAQECLATAPRGLERAVKHAHAFLQQQGCINTGVLRDDPRVPLPENFGPPLSPPTEGPPTSQSTNVTDEAVEEKLYELLSGADMQTTSEKMLRKELSGYFGVDMKGKKAYIRELVTGYLENGGPPPSYRERKRRAAEGKQSASRNPAAGRVIVVGAGPAGLASALHLKRNNVEVVVLEARDRVGGRVNSHQSQEFLAPLDLGASIITGIQADARKILRPDPSALLCRQLDIKLHPLEHSELPLFDCETGDLVDPGIDKETENLRDQLMDDAAEELEEKMAEEDAMLRSFGEMLEVALQKRIAMVLEEGRRTPEEVVGSVVDKLIMKVVAAVDGDSDSDEERPLPPVIGDEHLKLLQWHWANLEYGCSAPLEEISGLHWNQDEDFGGFGGPHCMVVGGYSQPFVKVAQLLDVRLSTPVTKIEDGARDVRVVAANGDTFMADAVIVTVPLGVLKTTDITFDPPLPPWKQEAIEKLGFGDLNKIVLQFPDVFWNDDVDFFGVTAAEPTPETRGECFMFWNLHRFTKAPILVALIAGKAARAAETASAEHLVARAMSALRVIYKKKHGAPIPEPTATLCSSWASEPFTRGSYSYIGVGASAKEYDTLALPVRRRVLFAGEHTVKEHPDTVGGAMISGVREAVRALELLESSETTMSARVLGGGGGRTEVKRKRTAEEEEEYLERRLDAAMGRDVAKLMDEQRAREAARQDMKAVWRALMFASNGDGGPLAEKLASVDSSSHQEWKVLAGALKQAETTARQTVSKDQRCLRILANWVEESCVQSALVDVTDCLLQTLLALSPPTHSILKGSGLEKAVRRCASHSDPNVRKQAATVLKMWVGSVVNPVGAQEQSEEVVGKAEMQNRLPIELDQDALAELEEAERQAQELEKAAAAHAAQAAQWEARTAENAEAPVLAASLKSFDAYRKELKSQKKKPKAKMERKAGSGGITDENIKKEVKEYCSKVLQKLYNARKISRDDFKAVLEKTVRKVCEKGQVSEGEEFLTVSEKKKISELIGLYIKQKKC